MRESIIGFLYSKLVISPLELHNVTPLEISQWLFHVCNIKVCVKVRYDCSLIVIYNDVWKYAICAHALYFPQSGAVW